MLTFLVSCSNSVNNEEVSSTINWISISDLEAKQAKQKKKVMIDAYTSWCGWCKKMDKHTFEHPEIAKYVNENFYAVKFDAETKEPINFKGKLYSFVQSGRRGYNELAKELLKGRLSYPTISFLNEDSEIINAFPGYKDAPQFDALLHFIGEGVYENNQSLTNYMSTFESPVQSIAAAVDAKKVVPINNSLKKGLTTKSQTKSTTPKVVAPPKKTIPTPEPVSAKANSNTLKVRPTSKKINPTFKVKRIENKTKE